MTLEWANRRDNIRWCYKKTGVSVHFSLSPRELELVGVDPLQALRHATQPLHQRLDAALPLGRQGAGTADYLQHLQVLRGWLAALDPLLRQTGWGAGYLDAAAAELALPSPPSVLSPLAALAAHEAATAIAIAPADAGVDFAWGAAYVVEGSQLGGQVLARRLREAGVEHPLAYLQGRGERTGAHWRNFVAALRAALAQPAATAAACRGACWAFDDLLVRFRARGLVA
jgi:heme oxygenase